MSELSLKDLIQFKEELHSRLVGERRDMNAEHIEIMRAAQAELNAANEKLRWQEGDQDFPVKGRYLIEFALDQGNGHVHYEELLCEHAPEYGKNMLLRPRSAGSGIPSISKWYGPISTPRGEPK